MMAIMKDAIYDTRGQSERFGAHSSQFSTDSTDWLCLLDAQAPKEIWQFL